MGISKLISSRKTSPGHFLRLFNNLTFAWTAYETLISNFKYVWVPRHKSHHDILS